MTITLIVPAYNEGLFIERCINSIKNQTVPFDQVIFIDDHSTDGTAEIIRAQTEFVRIEHPDNRGVSASRNSGLEQAKALEVLTKYPQEPMFRALYGNLTATEADSTPAKDCKVTTWLKPAYELSDVISTDDKCFENGAVGRYIRERFTEPSRWEV